MQRKVFRGVGAMVVQPFTQRRFMVTTKITDTQTFDFAPQCMVEVDLGRTPSRTDWPRVQVDDRGISADRVPLGSAPCTQLLEGFHVTNLGGRKDPKNPNSDDLSCGCLVGGVYLENDYFESIRDRIDLDKNPWPCDGRKTYQLTTINYSNAAENGARKNLRYHGFHARVVDPGASAGTGTVRRLELFDINMLTLEVVIDLDFANPLHIDDSPVLAAGETALSTASQAGDAGAVYIELAKLAAAVVTNPKLPIGEEQ